MSVQPTVLRRAAARDQGSVERLLQAQGLPTAGVAEWLGEFWIAEQDGGIVGVAGLERYGPEALLRSVAVDPAERGTGLGAALVATVLAVARAGGVRGVYLLTTTAERYFPRFGFERIEREDVPDSLRASVEFREACPASAAAMRRLFSDGQGSVP